MLESALAGLQVQYQSLKSTLLAAGAHGELPVAEMESRLRAASMTRRALEQAVKAALVLAQADAPCASHSPDKQLD